MSEQRNSGNDAWIGGVLMAGVVIFGLAQGWQRNVFPWLRSTIKTVQASTADALTRTVPAVGEVDSADVVALAVLALAALVAVSGLARLVRALLTTRGTK